MLDKLKITLAETVVRQARLLKTGEKWNEKSTVALISYEFYLFYRIKKMFKVRH